MAQLGGSSRLALAAIRSTLDEQMKTLSSADCLALSEELFVALVAFNSSTGLRRALTDPAREGAAKGELVADLFGKVIGATALTLITEAASLRWSTPSEIADCIEDIAVEAAAHAAYLDGNLDVVEDELFSFSRLLITSPELRQSLASSNTTTEAQSGLVTELLSGKVSNVARVLVVHAVTGFRGRNIEGTLADYSAAVNARRARVVAHVRTAVALSDAQRNRLAEGLAKVVGHAVHLNVEVDSSLVGGVTVRFADEIIDASVASRLAEASRVLVG